MTVSILGNSHVAAIRKGYDLVKGECGDGWEIIGESGRFEMEPFSYVRNGMVHFVHDGLAKRVKQLTGARQIRRDDGRIWGFCMGHNAHLYAQSVWRSHVPCHFPLLRPRQTSISSAVYDQIVLARYKNVLDFFGQAQGSGIRFFVIACPFPKRSHHILQKGALSPELLLDIDNRGRSVFRRWLGDMGIAFVEAPDVARGSDGFLDLRYCASGRADGKEDPHHANEEYGALMVRRILEQLKNY